MSRRSKCEAFCPGGIADCRPCRHLLELLPHINIRKTHIHTANRSNHNTLHSTEPVCDSVCGFMSAYLLEYVLFSFVACSRCERVSCVDLLLSLSCGCVCLGVIVCVYHRTPSALCSQAWSETLSTNKSRRSELMKDLTLALTRGMAYVTDNVSVISGQGEVWENKSNKSYLKVQSLPIWWFLRSPFHRDKQTWS